MKFARNARIFRGQLDAAPFAIVFFLLAIFMMVGSLIYTPGVSLELPVAENLPGTDRQSVAVAIDANGRLYFDDQVIGEEQLQGRLRDTVRQSSEPLTLIVHADKAVTYDRLMHVTLIARQAGINSAWLATLPPPLTPAP